MFGKMSPVEMSMLSKCQDWVHNIDPKIAAATDTKKRNYFRKEIMQYRDELRNGHSEFMKIRRAKLMNLLVADANQQTRLIQQLGYDYIPTQP